MMPELLGYCDPLSVYPGQSISFMVSSPTAFTMDFVRFYLNIEMKLVPARVYTKTFDCPEGKQTVPSQSWYDGCGWDKTVKEFQIPVNSRSGIFAARCVSVDH